MFKVIIAGSRNYSDLDSLTKYCDHLLSQVTDPIQIVSGCARGADSLGEQYAKSRNYSIAKFPADWGSFGKSAGYKRNVQMGKYSNALIAFPIGKSLGTNHMIDIATNLGLKIRVK